MHSLSVSRAHIAASNLGMAQRMLELSLAYAHDRVTFGKPIGTRQAIRVKIADMSMMVHALRCMVYDFAKAYMENPTGEYIEEKAAMCKLFSIDTTRKVSDEMLEIFGGVGYFEDCKYGPVERLLPRLPRNVAGRGRSDRSENHHLQKYHQTRCSHGVRV